MNSSPPKRARVSTARSAPLESVRHALEEPVTHLVAEAVVDELEPVEVEEHERHAGVVALGPAERQLQPVHEQHAVGEPGELVVDRRMGQTFARSRAVR